MIKFWAGATACLVGLCAGYGLASRNSSGTMSAINGPYTAGSVISSSVINARFADLETELSDSKSRSGKGDFSAPARGADGTVAAPTWSYTSETGSGLYRIGSSDHGFSMAGTKVGEWTVNGYRSADGAVATPSLSFFNDTGSGLYRIGANDLGFAVNGTRRQEWTTTGSSITGTLGLSDVFTQTIAGSASSNSFTSFAASLANGNNVSWLLGAAASNNSSGLLTYLKNATAANSTLCMTIYGQSSTLCVDGNGKTRIGANGSNMQQVNFGFCTLNGGTPATCTATVGTAAQCTANVITTTAANTRRLGVSNAAGTLTITSETNGDTGNAAYFCGG